MLGASRLARLAVLLLAAATGVVLACTTPQGTPVTYKNETGLNLIVTNDDFLLTTLAPTESKRITTKESLLPDRIRAYDERNNLVFDRTVTWEDLKASGFVVVIK